MGSDSDGDDEGFTRVARERKKRKISLDACSSKESDNSDKYENFIKPGYRRNYSDQSLNTEFPVFVEGLDSDSRLGNKNPLTISKIFKNVKGISEQRRVNANKIVLVFKQAAAANDFLNHKCLSENEFRAYIPASSVECVGVVKYIPKETSNQELFNKLNCEQEIVAVRRFKKKVDNEIVVFNTISVTFVGTSLPQYIYLENWRYKVYQYVPPVMQCFRCMKFNHVAKICKNIQVCSRCSGDHCYKECTEEVLKCSNCGGAHLAISKDCPFKQEKINNKKKTYANVTIANINTSFPALQKPALAGAVTSMSRSSRANTPVSQRAPVNNTQVNKNIPNISDLIHDEKFINIIVKTLVSLGNSNSVKTASHIRDTFLKNCRM